MISHSVAELLADHVRLTVEGIDRMYLNVYVPRLQCAYGAVSFFRDHRGQPLASSALMSPMSRRFVAELDRFIARHQLPVVLFRKGQRKDDVMVERLRDFQLKEGVVFVGKAQEKAPVFRTEKRHSPHSGRPYPWIVKSTAMVNHYYIYAVDDDFGPFFLKFCTYFPYTAKLCLNGHEYAKRQLERQGIAYQALDNSLPRRRPGVCSAAPIPSGFSRSATTCRPRRSTACCASGCTSSPIRSPPPIKRPASATIFRSFKPSFL
jgi:hypothetical protein